MARDRSPEARALSTLRLDRALTQKALAKLSGVHNATISSYERGRRPISPGSLAALLSAMGLTPRAWEATVRYFVWLDYLATGAPSNEGSIDIVAEHVAQDVERNLAALLRLVVTS